MEKEIKNRVQSPEGSVIGPRQKGEESQMSILPQTNKNAIESYKHRRSYRYCRTVFPSLFGTRDWFHGRQFFHRLGQGWFQEDSSAFHLLCTFISIKYPWSIC